MVKIGSKLFTIDVCRYKFVTNFFDFGLTNFGNPARLAIQAKSERMQNDFKHQEPKRFIHSYRFGRWKLWLLQEPDLLRLHSQRGKAIVPRIAKYSLAEPQATPRLTA